MNRLRIHLPVCLILALILWISPAGGAPESIRPILIKGIEANFSGDYDRAAEIFATIREVDPSHPAEAFYQAVVLFWRNSVDAGNPRYVNQIRAHLQQAMGQAERMLSADEQDVDALHYLGLVYTYLGRLEAHNGKLYRGGVLGERGRKYLERAIEICRQQKDATGSGSCDDVYFPYGAYSYFAGRLPQFLQAFNFLWFIPSGSTEEGLAALARAHGNSDLHRLGAQSLLVGIFLNFEADRIPAARELSDQLVARFPDNPYLEIQHANLLVAAGELQQAVAAAWKILAKVDQQLRNYDEVVRQAALLVKTEAAIRQGNASQARDLLVRLKNDPSYQRNSLTPYTDLLLGMQADMTMSRETAIEHYERATSYKGEQRNRIVARRAKQYLKNPFVR